LVEEVQVPVEAVGEHAGVALVGLLRPATQITGELFDVLRHRLARLQRLLALEDREPGLDVDSLLVAGLRLK